MELEILKWLGYVLTGILGWFVRVLWTAQEKMREDFSRLEKNMPLDYVPRVQFEGVIKDIKDAVKEVVTPIMHKLDRMEEKHDIAISDIHGKLFVHHRAQDKQ